MHIPQTPLFLTLLQESCEVPRCLHLFWLDPADTWLSLSTPPVEISSLLPDSNTEQIAMGLNNSHIGVLLCCFIYVYIR